MAVVRAILLAVLAQGTTSALRESGGPLLAPTTAIILVSGGSCSALEGCSAATTQPVCSEWAETLTNSTQPVHPLHPLRSEVPTGCYYLYGDTERVYFNPGPSQTDCSAERTCVCACTQSPRSLVTVAVFVGDGTTARARSNPIAVLNRPGTNVRAVNFSASDIQNHLTRASYDVVLFPGGGGSTEAAAIGAVGMSAVKDFVARGGGYIGICAGAFLAIQHLDISGCHDIPRPVSGKERGDGNVTLALTNAGASDLAPFNISQRRLNSTLVFYANGPVMAVDTQNHSIGVSNVTVLVTYSSKSVPIEAGYTGPTAGYEAAAVCTNRFSTTHAIWPGQDDDGGGVGGMVLVSGPHPETDELDFPDRGGPPSERGSVRADLLISYVKFVAP